MKALSKVQKELKDIVELYTGRKVKNIQTYPDQNNSSYTAIRVEFLDDNSVVDYNYFLIQSSLGNGFDRDSLEEVEFESWPPKSKPQNMMKIENMSVSVIS